MQGHFHVKTEFPLSIFSLCVYTQALIHCFIQHIFIRHQGYNPWASFVAQQVKNPPAMWETWVSSLGWADPLEKGNATTLVFWPGEFHGLYNPWGHKESGTTEGLSVRFTS